MAQEQVAIYARVSSDQQAQEGTIDSQLAALHERVEADGLSLSQELTFIDEGYSGANLIRPGLEQLRDVVALTGLERLCVHSPDRLARRYAYQVLLMDEFQQAGADVVFLNRELGRNPEDELLLQVQGMIAEYERAKILERSRRGKRFAARSGEVAVLSGAPYGYHYVSKQEGGGQASYEVVSDEALLPTAPVPPSPPGSWRKPSSFPKKLIWYHLPSCRSASIEFSRLLLAVKDSALPWQPTQVQCPGKLGLHADFSRPFPYCCQSGGPVPPDRARDLPG